MRKLTLFGERVLVEPVEEMSGSLIVAAKASRTYEFGRIVKVGDGLVSDGKGGKVQKKMHLNEGEIVWFQTNAYMAAGNATAIDGKVYMALHQNDVLATMSKPIANIENLKIAGNWCLLRSDVIVESGSEIIRPDTAKVSYDEMAFYIEQVGSQVDCCKANDNVVVDFKMVQKIDLGGKQFFYTASNYIYGIIEPPAGGASAKSDGKKHPKGNLITN